MGRGYLLSQKVLSTPFPKTTKPHLMTEWAVVNSKWGDGPLLMRDKTKQYSVLPVPIDKALSVLRIIKRLKQNWVLWLKIIKKNRYQTDYIFHRLDVSCFNHWLHVEELFATIIKCTSSIWLCTIHLILTRIPMKLCRL